MKSTQNSSNSSKKTGNTNQSSPKVHWCFTLNNYSQDDIHYISSNSSIKSYIFQEETGEEGTPHLQGYLAFKSKQRLSALKKINPKIHWEPCRDIKASIAYCSKSETRTGKIYANIPYPKPLKCLKYEQLYDWQKNIVDIAKTEPDDRTIHWVWEEEGNRGKSQLIRYLVIKHNALILSNKASDMKYGCIKYAEKNHSGPEIICINIPRSVDTQYLSYQGIEDIKDATFFSPKYESDMFVMNPPHIFIFSNEYPETEKLSSDRWKVISL